MARLVSLANLEQFAAVNLNADPGLDPSNPPIPGVEVRLNWTQEDGKTAHNVLFAEVPVNYTVLKSDADAMLTALTTGAGWTGMAAFMATNTGLSSVSLRDHRQNDMPYINSTVGPGSPGASASPSLPNEVAVCVTLRTDRVGPNWRGRMFIPNFATNALGAGNVVAATAVTAINAWVQTIFTAFTARTFTWSLGLHSRIQYTSPITGKVHPARSAQVIHVLTANCRDNRWDSQRRRGLK